MMLHALSTLCLMARISCFLAEEPSDHTPKGRIFNGVATRQGDMPFVMKLIFKYDGGHLCTAFLIHPRWLLTAAHCEHAVNGITLVMNPPPETNQNALDITNFIMPEEYARNATKWADIALVFLGGSGISSSIEPVRIATPSTSPWNRLLNTEGATAAVAGYGQIDQYGTPAKTLYKTYLFPEHCDDPTDFRLCFGGGPALESSCPGDSGGPVMLEEATSKLAFGVVTAGSYSGCRNDSGTAPWISYMYAVRITTHLDWIKEILCGYGDKLSYLSYTCP